MEQAELEHARQLFEDAVRARLAGTAIDKVELLQYGDVPEIEPGELLGRVFLTPPEGADPADMAVRRQDADGVPARRTQERSPDCRRRSGVSGPARDCSSPRVRRSGPDSPGPLIHLKIKLSRGSSALGLSGGDQPLTAVMARLGPDDLETLDTLIAAGIASSRAEAVRWALARIRERPAYEQLRARAREIEDLKSQF